MPCVLSRHMLRDWPMCNKAAEEGEGEETNTQRQGEKGQQAAASAPTPLAPEWTIAALSSPSHRFARLRLKVDEQPSDGAADFEDSAAADADGEADPFHPLSGEPFKLPLSAFMQYLHWNRDDVPLYVFDGAFETESGEGSAEESGEDGESESSGAAILREFSPPRLFQPDLFALLGELRRPPYRWLLLGPARSGSALHTDPLATSAWNTCLAGVKQWVLFPPGTPRAKVKGAHLARPDVLQAAGYDAADPTSEQSREAVEDAMEAVFYFTHSLPLLQEQWDEGDAAAASSGPAAASAIASAHSAGSSPYGQLTFLQFPGETVFVPHGWLHAVINLTPTVALTQNYVSESNLAAAWAEAKGKRPHTARRWRAQVERERPELLRLMPLDDGGEADGCDAAESGSDSGRRPDLPLDAAALDPESWYWNPSSDEEEEEGGEGAADDDYS